MVVEIGMAVGMADDKGFTVEGRGLLKKSQSVVMAREHGGEIDLVDRKLFNYLLQRAYPSLMERQVHRIPVQDALEFLCHTSTSRLHESLDRLGTVSIEIEYEDDAGIRHSARAHFLSYDLSRAADGVLQFAFDPLLLQFLWEPKVYASLSLHRVRSFRGAHASRLYEVMALYHRRFSPHWRISVDDLRAFFRVEDSHARWDNFRRKVIERAVDEVNRIADFEVSVEYVRGGRGGRIVEVVFTAAAKSHARLMEARAMIDPVGRVGRDVRDCHTVDLLDGRTDAERGGPAVVSVLALEQAREMAGGTVAHYEQEWREEMRGRVVRDPDLSFLRWLDMRLQREQDALLADLNEDTFGNLLEELG